LKRIVVFGNSGSGKTTYAHEQSARFDCACLDLDTVAWEPAREPPARRPLAASRTEILAFVNATADWIVEGCYADLLAVALPHATEIVFLNPGTDTCVENARNRPWEPHKYSSPAAQDRNLHRLIDWIRAYDQRTDEFSCSAHRRLFNNFAGPKLELRSNERGSR
tara:strand:+ start:2107 stop:2601 length:495 start_codon:yes stop_codon:yes gene_type:complete